MKFSRAIRSMLLAGGFAALCIWTSVAGALITLVAGIIALASMPRTDSESASGFSEYLPWLVCTLSFVATAIVLAPFAVLPAVVIALCVLSPFFGTMIYVVERAVFRPTMFGR